MKNRPDEVEARAITSALGQAGDGPTTALSSLSLDKLWTYYEQIVPSTPAKLKEAEIVRRLIDLRSEPEGWFTGNFGTLLLIGDISLTAGAGSVALNPTGDIQYSEDATPSGAFSVTVTFPANYLVEIWDASLTASASAATYSMMLVGQSGDYVAQIISELLNLSKHARSEASGSLGAPWDVSRPQVVKIFSNVELGASVTLKARARLRWKRIPTWVARV